MMAWKYIVMEIELPGGTRMAFPVIFPDKMVHAEVFAVTKFVVPAARPDGGNVKVVAAGAIEHVTVDGLGGRSTTLGISSRGDEDAKMIDVYSYCHGVT